MSRSSRTVALCLTLLLLLAGCDRGSDPDTVDDVASGPGSGDPAPAAPPAGGDALTRGLQAHVDGDLDAAVAAYQEVLAEDPDNHLALYNLGLVEQSRGNNDDAETYYRRTIDVNGEYTPALFNLAILRTAAGDNEEAVTLYEKVVSLEEDNAGAYLNMGFALRELGRDDEATDAFNRAIELDPAMADRITEQ